MGINNKQALKDVSKEFLKGYFFDINYDFRHKGSNSSESSCASRPSTIGLYQSRNYKGLIHDKSSQIKEDIEEDISSKDSRINSKRCKVNKGLLF